jgi:hypothetical protein
MLTRRSGMHSRRKQAAKLRKDNYERPFDEARKKRGHKTGKISKAVIQPSICNLISKHYTH